MARARKIWYMLAALLFTFLACSVQPVMAANVWDKAKEIMKDVYNQIVLISTIAAVVTASVALLMMTYRGISCSRYGVFHHADDESVS